MAHAHLAVAVETYHVSCITRDKTRNTPNLPVQIWPTHQSSDLQTLAIERCAEHMPWGGIGIREAFDRGQQVLARAAVLVSSLPCALLTATAAEGDLQAARAPAKSSTGYATVCAAAWSRRIRRTRENHAEHLLRDRTLARVQGIVKPA